MSDMPNNASSFLEDAKTKLAAVDLNLSQELRKPLTLSTARVFRAACRDLSRCIDQSLESLSVPAQDKWRKITSLANTSSHLLFPSKESFVGIAKQLSDLGEVFVPRYYTDDTSLSDWQHIGCDASLRLSQNLFKASLNDTLMETLQASQHRELTSIEPEAAGDVRLYTSMSQEGKEILALARSVPETFKNSSIQLPQPEGPNHFLEFNRDGDIIAGSRPSPTMMDACIQYCDDATNAAARMPDTYQGKMIANLCGLLIISAENAKAEMDRRANAVASFAAISTHNSSIIEQGLSQLTEDHQLKELGEQILRFTKLPDSMFLRPSKSGYLELANDLRRLSYGISANCTSEQPVMSQAQNAAVNLSYLYGVAAHDDQRILDLTGHLLDRRSHLTKQDWDQISSPNLLPIGWTSADTTKFGKLTRELQSLCDNAEIFVPGPPGSLESQSPGYPDSIDPKIKLHDTKALNEISRQCTEVLSKVQSEDDDNEKIRVVCNNLQTITKKALSNAWDTETQA